MDYKTLFSEQQIEEARRENPFVSVTDVVRSAMEKAIIRQQILPDEKLVIKQLSEAFGVSNTTIREAMDSLVTAGLVTVSQKSQRQHEYRTAAIDTRTVERLFEVRRAIEGESAYLCAKWMDEDFIRDLKANVEEFNEILRTLDRKEVVAISNRLSRLDREFHVSIVAAVDNPYLYETYQSVGKRLEYLSYLTSRSLREDSDERLRLLGKQHRAICHAIETGLSEEARTLMLQHLDYCMQALIRMI